MKQLVEASGVAKSTILFYVSRGLLPRPVKTSRNMAYYHPSCVDRLKLIKDWQSNWGLSLERIAKLLTFFDQGQDVTPLLELNQMVFGRQSDEAELDRKEFLLATGLNDAQLDELLAARLLLPLNPPSFDAQDVALGQIYAQALSFGTRVEEMEYYPRLGAQIVDHEMDIRRRRTQKMSISQDAEETTRMVRFARTIRVYVIDRIFQHRIAAMSHLKDD
jgi:DNA-binding transcriptional MerR regulator